MADLHTHMIPGVDDGAADLDSAIEALHTLYRDGIGSVVATPHLNASRLHGNRRVLADQAWPTLVQRSQEELPDLKLYRGFEILLDVPEVDLSDDALRLGGTRFALVEFHAFTIPERSAAVLARICEDGYVPIIVHPERYWGYNRQYDVVPEWRAAGALLQMNSGSLLGEYGEHVRTIAHRFLEEGRFDLIASDNHARPSRSPSLISAWEYLVTHGFEEQARLLLATNPHRILKDEMPISVGRLQPKRNFLSRFTRALGGGR